MAFLHPARICILLGLAVLLGALAGTAISARTPARAALGSELPRDIFVEGAKVRSGGAVYLIQRIEGEWIQVIPYRSLDDHEAPPGVPRWIYVPAVDGPWSAVPGS